MTDSIQTTDSSTSQTPVATSSAVPQSAQGMLDPTHTAPAPTESKEPTGFLGRIAGSVTDGLQKASDLITSPLGLGQITPENLAQKLEILDQNNAIDSNKVLGVQKMKFGTEVEAISFVHKENGKSYIILPNPRRILPLKGAQKIISHTRILGQDYLEYENNYLIPFNQRCACDIHGEIFVSNYKYIDPQSITVNGQDCIKVAYDYGDTGKEVFTLINKSGHRIPGLSFNVEKITGVVPILCVTKQDSKYQQYFFAEKEKINERSSHIDQAYYHGEIKDMLVFSIFDKTYVLGVDGEWITISDTALVQDMLSDNQKKELLQSV